MRLTGERPRDEAAADASIAGHPEFLIDPLLIAVAKTDDAEAARFGDRLCQRSTGSSSHRGKKNRMADAELLGELCAKRHRVCPFYFVVCALIQPLPSNTRRTVQAPIFQQNNTRRKPCL